MTDDLSEEEKVKLELTIFTEQLQHSKSLFLKSFQLINEAKKVTKTVTEVAKLILNDCKEIDAQSYESASSSLNKVMEFLDLTMDSLKAWEKLFFQQDQEQMDSDKFSENYFSEDEYREDKIESSLNEFKVEDSKVMPQSDEKAATLFSCEFCQFCSHNEDAAIRHKQTHAKFTCTFCDYSCDRLLQMKSHILKKHDVPKLEFICESLNSERKHYLCPHCTYSATKLSTVDAHLKTKCKYSTIKKKKVIEPVTETVKGLKCSSPQQTNDALDEIPKVKGDEYKCDRCSYVTTNKIYHTDHVTGSLRYRKCPWCEVHVSTGIKFISGHLRSKHGQGKDSSPFCCLECGEKLKRLSSLELHLAKVHGRGNVYHCGWCSYSSPCFKTVTSHASIHKGPFCCDICGAFLSSKASLRNHMEGKHGSKKFQCHLCSFSSTRKFGLTQHITIHTGNILLCDQCHFTTVHKANLVKHIQRKHSKEPRKETDKGQYPCDLCNAKYSTSLGLKRHKKKHAAEPEPISCSEAGCDYVTSRSDNLKHHHEKVHQGIRWPCGQCDYVGGYKSDLNRHVKFTHQGYLLKCEQCKYTTPKKCRLSWHMTKVHQTTESRWLCDSCDFVAGYEGELNRHIKIVHNGFTLKCEYCDYATPKKYRLKCHVNKVHERKIAR